MPTAKMSNAIYDTQAAFDPTICFTVYGSWIQNIYISRQRTRNNVALERKPP